MSHGPSRGVMHVRQQLWCDACAASLKPFRLAVPFAELRVFRCSGVRACRRSGVMSRQCSLCMVTRNLDQFPQHGGRRCRRCQSAIERMRRLAAGYGYQMSFLATVQGDRDLQDFMHAIVDDPHFTFRNYYGVIHSDDARTRRARSAGDPPPPPLGSPPRSLSGHHGVSESRRRGVRAAEYPPPPPGPSPSSPSGQNAFGPMRVRVRIDASGPFSVTISGGPTS